METAKLKLARAAILGLLGGFPGSELSMEHCERTATVHHEHTHEEVHVDTSLVILRPQVVFDSLILELRTGTAPKLLANADDGLLLATAKIKTDGTSSGEIVASGSAGHFRIKTSAGIVVAQGAVLSDEGSTHGDVSTILVDNPVCVVGGVFALGCTIS